MSKDDPIQEQLIAARRQQILGAAIQAFSEKGFHRATIRDVAKVAKIADGTIYNYFSNKQELLLGILDLINDSDNRAEDFAKSDDMDLREYMTIYLKRRLEAISIDGLKVLRVVLSEVLINDELREIYYQRTLLPTIQLSAGYFEKWIAEGRIRVKDANAAMRFVASTTTGMLMMRLFGDAYTEDNWQHLIEQTTNIIIAGLEVQS